MRLLSGPVITENFVVSNSENGKIQEKVFSRFSFMGTETEKSDTVCLKYPFSPEKNLVFWRFLSYNSLQRKDVSDQNQKRVRGVL